MSRSIKYTDEELIEAVKKATSKRQTLFNLGLIPAGGNYKCLETSIERLKLDTSHFLGKGSNKGKQFPAKRKIETFIEDGAPIQSYKLKLRLLKEKYFEAKCYNCNNLTWLGNPIPLELEHIDGNNSNNTLTNLTLLCPNCHALTSTYRGKNKKKA